MPIDSHHNRKRKERTDEREKRTAFVRAALPNGTNGLKDVSEVSSLSRVMSNDKTTKNHRNLLLAATIICAHMLVEQ